MKKALIILGVLLVLAAGAAYLVVNKLDVIAHYAIEKYGSEMLGVEVKVKDVELSATDGKGALKGVEIATPKGFSAPRTARVGQIRLAVEPATIRDDLIVIREIAVEAPEIWYDRAGSGATNLDAIQKNIEGYLQRSGTPAEGKAAGPQAPGRRYVIEKVSIRGARVTMTTSGLKGQGIGFTLPDIELRNIGRKPDGVTAAQAANVVTNALISKIAQKVLTNIDLLRRGGKDAAIDALKNLVR
ncbi:hypothetical protein DSM104443_03329 [Usitatibacter rugosus]|uniref:AsmA-like protein n=1 Tax=Usitatibacter rugosus TaxID=2732067 RepID=A0A6M4H0R8_9PROT|nr:hypothetical protein [Usitatibacter rugosus]QJR12244.1 hypothetical protein DSM104443_03329 [Usitatibacter rugosus]